MTNHCAMTGREINGPGDAIWDDGEWISWDWINEQLRDRELREMFPNADPEVVTIFEELVYLAQEYRQLTGRHLSVFGELGELFVEILYGMKRHKLGAAGSDGRAGNDFIEVKTISPLKATDRVIVKRGGHFSKLVVVKISDEFSFEARALDRKSLSKGTGKFAKVSWLAMKPITGKLDFG